MTDLTMIYHNASGKRNQMTINMDEFFPCAKCWLTKLQKTVISRSVDPDGYTDRIRTYLQMQYDMADLWLKDNSCGDGPMIGVSPADYKKVTNNKKRLRACLEVIGGSDGQHDSTAGEKPARN